MPKQPYERYVKQKTTSAFCVWRFHNPCKKISAKKTLRIEVMADAEIKWTNDNWETTNTIKTKNTEHRYFLCRYRCKKFSEDKKIEFTFYWKKADCWENENFCVDVEE